MAEPAAQRDGAARSARRFALSGVPLRFFFFFLCGLFVYLLFDI